MIFDAATLRLPLRVKADLCVIGSGPGGATAAMIAAEAGMKVLILEAGELLTPADMTQREEQMFPRLFWDGGARTTADRGVKIHQGRGLGGSALHNLNLCKRAPETIRAAWAKDRHLESLDAAGWSALYGEVEALLGVAPIPEAMWNRHNRLLELACQRLGWRGGGLSHNRTGCVGSGYCEVGCAFDAKNNTMKVVLPRALRAGAEALTHCQAVRIRHDSRGARGVDAVARAPKTHDVLGTIEIDADRICVSASATGTAALLLRSEVTGPPGSIGDTLRIHPAVVAAGDFDEPIHAWQGVPQTYECTEWLDFDHPGGHRTWIIPAFAHPVATATMLPGHGAAHHALMSRYPNLAVLTAMLHDETTGTVRPRGDLGLRIDYWPDAADRRELAHGLWASAKLLFAAGARRVVVPTASPLVFERESEIDALPDLEIERGEIDIVAVHPMATVPMSDDPSLGAVDSHGRHHQIRGLWVSDGSLFPTSIGGPPQLSIYALGLHVGRAILRA